MREIVILLDSTCDLTPALLEKWNLEYIPMGISIGDKTYEATLEWKDFTPKEYYDIMRKGSRVFTIQVNEQQFLERFNKILDEGKDVLYISCSSALSASVKSALLAKEEIAKTGKEGKILIVDPLCSGMSQGLLGIKASELRAEGKSIEEIAQFIEDTKLNYNQWATVGALTYLARAGRVKASKAFFGNLFGVKPIIISDLNGANFAYKKVKGRKAALEEIAQSCIDSIVDQENQIVAIAHADCVDDANAVKELLLSKGLKCKELLVLDLGPILGASCGPDTIGIFHYGKKKTIVGE